MRSQEKLDNEMSRISQPVDSSTDPFVNLFNERKESEMTARQRPRVHMKRAPRIPARRRPASRKPARKSLLADRLTKFSKSVKGIKLRQPVIRKPIARQNPSDGVSMYLWLPIFGVVFSGIFSVGYFGVNLAGSGIGVTAATDGNLTVQAVAALPVNKPSIVGVDVQNNPTGSKIVAKVIERNTTILPQRSVSALAAVQVPIAAVRVNPQQEVINLLRDGHRYETLNNFQAARARFRQAYIGGASAAALAMARTYDKRFVKVGGDVSDAQLAREWYEKWFLAALERGEISPRARYDRLLKGLAQN